MDEHIRFRKEDIGAELLPILTAGLYRNALDTLREYIQNSIDADAKKIELVVDPDVVSIRDDGAGMTAAAARRAIRLGISEKSPLEDVGFRGIGIYSAFNLCDHLVIHTRASRQKTGYVLKFEFKRMRAELLHEAERAKQDKPRGLYLEKLLQESVSVAPDDSETLSGHGTLAILSAVREDVYDLLLDWEEVTRYLQNVVPLPFRPDFRYKEEIEGRFSAEDYRVVKKLTLQIAGRREELHRPYHDGMFTHGGQYPPKFFEAASNGRKMGFAWASINDARRVLPEKNLRGILIKKFGFSISDRNFLEPYYGRTVFNRRLTGELIVQDEDLVPNAARSDFEHNAARQLFFQDAIPGLIKEVSAWAGNVQQEAKAREVLADNAERVARITSEFPVLQRDKEQLLRLNVQLARMEDEMAGHATVLKKIEAAHFKRTTKALSACQRTVREALTERRRTRRKLEDRAARSVESESIAPTDEERGILRALPTSLVDLLDSFQLLEDPDTRRAMVLLDEEVLMSALDSAAYRDVLLRLRELLEERP